MTRREFLADAVSVDRAEKPDEKTEILTLPLGAMLWGTDETNVE